jgi:hypothetical protein
MLYYALMFLVVGVIAGALNMAVTCPQLLGHRSSSFTPTR